MGRAITDVEQEPALKAEWRVYRASVCDARTLAESRATVVHTFLNARYLNPAQGQFTSEDPMFWGQQNLQDPQSFNAYSYSDDNPITKEDPSGKSFEISYTRVANNRIFSAGVSVDQNGIDYFASGGIGYGASTGIDFSWTPNEDLPHVNQVQVQATGGRWFRWSNHDSVWDNPKWKIR
jgi:RHS repeat-associated protein